MIEVKRDKIRRCFQLILEKRYSDAKDLLKLSDTCEGSNINPGIKFAIEGIISYLNDKSKEQNVANTDQLKKLRQFFKSKISPVWNDDFDREYFGLWIDFLNFLLKQLKSETNAGSVANDPRKEPEGYEAA